MSADLKIKVSADVADAVAGIKKLGEELTSAGAESASAASKISSSVEKIPGISSEAASAIKNISDQIDKSGSASSESIRDLVKSLDDISPAIADALSESAKLGQIDIKKIAFNAEDAEKAIKSLDDEIGHLADSGINQLEQRVAGLKVAIRSLSKEQLDSAFGKVLTKDLKEATEKLKELKHESGVTAQSFGKEFNKVGREVREIFEIAVGGGLVGSIFGNLKEISGAIDELFSHTKELTKAEEEHKKQVEEITTKTGEETARVSVLVKALESGTLSREKSKAAIQELQKIAPDYFNNLDKEKVKIEDVAKAYLNYNNALVASIEAQIRIAELTKATQERLAAQEQFKEATEFIKKQIEAGKSLDQINKEIASQDVAAAIKRSSTATDNQIHSNNILVQQEKNRQAEQQKTTSQQIKGVNDVLVALIKEQNILATIKPTDLKIDFEKAKAVVPVDIKLKPSLPERASAIQFQQDILDIVNGVFKKGEGTSAALKGFELRPLVTIKPELILSPEALRTKELELAFAATADKIGSILSNLLTSSIAQVGAAIGDILSGEGFSSAIKGFGLVLGDALIQIGKATISFAIEVSAIKKAIDKLIASGPVGATVAVGLGIAAIALGTALKSKLGKTKAFGDGGIVTGPVNAIVGERGPEAIFPLSQLKKFIGGISGGGDLQPVVLETRLSGDDIFISQQRVQRRRDRLG